MSTELQKFLGVLKIAKVVPTEVGRVQADLTDVEKSSLATKLLNAAVGSDLLQHYVEHTNEYARLNEVDIYAAVLQKSIPLDSACTWATEEQYGPLLEHLLNEKGKGVKRVRVMSMSHDVSNYLTWTFFFFFAFLSLFFFLLLSRS